MDLKKLLRNICKDHVLAPCAVFQKSGTVEWPVTIENEDALEKLLKEGGHFLPLPTEPAALANVLEESIATYVIEKINEIKGVQAVKGTDRGYPDVEIKFKGAYHALDIKVAKRGPGINTQSRITLYTGNTYFRYPQHHWPGTFRPFADYASHLDLVALYTFNGMTDSRIDNLQILIHSPWEIASRRRSSTTREYIGAVQKIADLEAGRGEFGSEKEFYDYWRKYQFKQAAAAGIILTKLLEAKK